VSSAFDALADSYDDAFTRTAIGTMMRRAVWARLAARFAPGSRVLEMNCGTGEDALWLARRGVRVHATDISMPMLQAAQDKLTTAGADAAVSFQRLAWEELDTLDEAPFDGVLSNFGGLNCVRDLRAAAHSLAARIRPGGTAMLCIMGPIVPWEWVWFLLHGEPRTALRRLHRDGVEWSGIKVRYPSISRTRRAFAPEFRMLRVSAVGTLLPPAFVGAWADRHPRLVSTLNRMERYCETLWPLPRLADHYLIELERV
jgi:SAM-dependent methyltransferase